MSTENLDGIYSLPAAADLRTNQHQGVSINTSGEYALTAAGAIPDAWLHNKPNTGEMGRGINMVGVVVKAKVGTGGVTRGARVSIGTDGIVISVTTGHAYVGKALSAGAAGDIISMMRLGSLGAVA
jgi:hypothetical protein